MVLCPELFQSPRRYCSKPAPVPAGLLQRYRLINNTNSRNNSECFFSDLISFFNFVLATPRQDVLSELMGRRGIDFSQDCWLFLILFSAKGRYKLRREQRRGQARPGCSTPGWGCGSACSLRRLAAGASLEISVYF